MSRSSHSAGRAQNSAPNMIPVFVTIGVVVVAALGVAVMTQPPPEGERDPAATAEPSEEAVSNSGQAAFGDIDTSREAISRGGSKLSNKAPAGLADHPAFTEGRDLAAKAKVLLDAALAARKAGDEDTYRTKGSAALVNYEEAMRVTSDWEINLIDEYGSKDRQVDKIGKEIDRWRKLMNKVRKVH